MLPRWEQDDCSLTLLAGHHAGRQAPATLYTPLVGIDIQSHAGGALRLPLDPTFEYGLLPLEGSLEIDGEPFASDEFAYLGQGRTELAIQLAPGSRVLLLGGEPFGEPVLMWWNFVGHSKAAIIQAQRDWEAGDPRFGPVPGSTRRLSPPPLPWSVG